MTRVLLNLTLVFVLAGGCSADDDTGGRSGAPGASSDDDDDTSTPIQKDGGAAGKDAGKKDAGKPGKGTVSGGGPGDTCESKSISAHSTPPDMLIVLDKSLSMAPTRWAPSTAAVRALTSKYQTLVSFGLEIFPAGFTCEPGILDVPLALNNAAKIDMSIAAAIPIGITPTAQSLRNALKFLGDRTSSGDNTSTPTFVVLVTDGEPNCMDDATPDPPKNSIEAAQALFDAGILVYVIGYEIGAPGEPTMNAMAMAGGTDKYFPVENQADLEAAFDKITEDVVRCEFDLSEVPADPSYVRVTIDGDTVPLDDPDGWSIDERKITLTGGSCATLKDGSSHLLAAKVECAPVMVM
ncbi:MAG: hypothetical protein RLZZ450_2549 [Pseudomonadota bacterium]|jgi:Mg-chelatase subunit ChlD